jgi:hypothetical protein
VKELGVEEEQQQGRPAAQALSLEKRGLDDSGGGLGGKAMQRCEKPRRLIP